MHELSVCQQLLSQATRVAREHGAQRIERIVVAAGPLSGVEPDLLLQAFSVARAGSMAEAAELDIERGVVVVRCQSCRTESEVAPNRLLCAKCGNWQVEVIQGEDLLLLSLELAGLPAENNASDSVARQSATGT
jgi:hydrogenase nickel incorporation protein HypA/HybF